MPPPLGATGSSADSNSTVAGPLHHSVRARLRSGVTLNLIGTLFAQGSTFALNLAVANVLGRFAFGGFTVVQGTISMVATLAQFATGYTATKFVAELRDREPQRAARILRLCARVSSASATLAAAAVLLAAPTIASSAFRAPHLTPWLRLAAPTVLFVVLIGFRTGALAGLEAYSALARSGVISGVVYLGAGLIGASQGVGGALAGIAGSAAFQWMILGRFLRRELRAKRIPSAPTDIWQERATLLHFALPATVIGVFSLPALWLASAFLVRQPGGMDQIALFGAANNFRIIALFLPNTLIGVGMSLLNNERGRGGAGYRALFWGNLRLTAACVGTAAAAIAALGPLLLNAFGNEFTSGYAVLRVLMVAAVLEAMATWTYQVIQSHGRMWLTLFLVTLPRDCMLVLVAYWLTPQFGAVGLATAHALSWALALLIIVILTYRVGLTGSSVEVPVTLPPTTESGSL